MLITIPGMPPSLYSSRPPRPPAPCSLPFSLVLSPLPSFSLLRAPAHRSLPPPLLVLPCRLSRCALPHTLHEMLAASLALSALPFRTTAVALFSGDVCILQGLCFLFVLLSSLACQRDARSPPQIPHSSPYTAAPGILYSLVHPAPPSSFLGTA